MSFDTQMIHEYNSDLAKANQELAELLEIQKMISAMLPQQGENLNQVEVKVESAKNEVEESVALLQDASKEKSKDHRFTLILGSLPAAGAAIGAFGFFVNPLVGAIAMATLTGLGAGVGGVIYKIRN